MLAKTINTNPYKQDFRMHTGSNEDKTTQE